MVVSSFPWPFGQASSIGLRGEASDHRGLILQKMAKDLPLW